MADPASISLDDNECSRPLTSAARLPAGAFSWKEEGLTDDAPAIMTRSEEEQTMLTINLPPEVENEVLRNASERGQDAE